MNQPSVSLLPIPQLPDFVMKCLCTLDGAMNLTFQMNQPSSMFVAREIMQKLCCKFSDVFLPALLPISLFWFNLCHFSFTWEIFHVLLYDTKSGEKRNLLFFM